MYTTLEKRKWPFQGMQIFLYVESMEWGRKMKKESEDGSKNNIMNLFMLSTMRGGILRRPYQFKRNQESF